MVPKLLVYTPLRARARSWAALMLVKMFWASETRDFSTTLKYCGMAIEARMPMMSTTTSSSISVKPFLTFFIIVVFPLFNLSCRTQSDLKKVYKYAAPRAIRSGAPGAIRTRGHPLKRRMLYH